MAEPEMQHVPSSKCVRAGQALFNAAAWLALPLALLLCLQWPLRDWVQVGSRLANDTAQWLFAVYVALAVPAASWHGRHLSTQGAEQGAPKRWRVWAVLACVAPWALGVLWAGGPSLWASLRQAERFADTLNPGYFLIKLALGLLAVLVLGVSSLACLGLKAPVDEEGDA